MEALFADLFVALDTAQYFAKSGAKLLRSERVPHHSTAGKAKSGRLIYEPVGVIGWYRYGADLERAADGFLKFEFGGGFAAKLRNARSALKTMFRDHGLRDQNREANNLC